MSQCPTQNTSEQTLKVKSTREVIVLHDHVIRHLETNLYTCMHGLVIYLLVPGQQNALILLQLLHKGGIGLCDSTPLFDVLIGSVQIPAILLHCICNHSGGRAAHAHLTMHQTFHPCFPAR